MKKIVSNLVLVFKKGKPLKFNPNCLFELVNDDHTICVEIESRNNISIYPMDSIKKIEYKIEKGD